MSTYTVTCVKARATITGSISDAIIAARAMSNDLQPAFGVSIEDDNGLVVLSDVTDAEYVLVETMPDHLCDSHRAAGNWGRYPANGAERSVMTRHEAEEVVADDEDGYAHIVRSLVEAAE